MPFFKKGKDRIKFVESQIDPETGIDKARQVAKDKGYDEVLKVQKGDRNAWIRASDFEGAKKKGYDLDHVVQGKKDTQSQQLERVKKEQSGALGTARGALASVAKGGTFGFSDEIAGGLSYLGSKGKNASERAADYNAARDEERLNQQAFQEEHPVANFAGELVGGAAIPVAGLAGKANLGTKIAKSAGLGAGLGALSGAGESKDISSIPEESLKGAAVGGAIGGALPIATTAGKAGLMKLGELRHQASNKVRNVLNKNQGKAQKEASNVIGDPELLDYYHGGGREKFNEGVAEAGSFINRNDFVDKANKISSIQHEKNNPYLLKELREAKANNTSLNRDSKDLSINNKINDLDEMIVSQESKVNRSNENMALKKDRESVYDDIKELAPEVVKKRNDLLTKRKEIGQRRDNFFDYVDSEVGQTPASVQMIHDIENSLKKSLEDISVVDPKIIGDYTNSSFQNQNIAGNLKKAISGQAGPEGKIFPVFDTKGELVPIQSAGQALKVMTDLMTTARRKAGPRNAQGEYGYSDNPETLSARRLLSRLGGDEEKYLEKLGLPEDSLNSYRQIRKDFSKNYTAENKLNSISGKVGKRGEFIPSESKTINIIKDKYKRASLLKSLRDLNDPELNTLVQDMEKSGMRIGEIEKSLRKNNLGQEISEKSQEKLNSLRKKALNLRNRKSLNDKTNEIGSELSKISNERADYKRLPLGERLRVLKEKAQGSPELDSLLRERDILDKSKRHMIERKMSHNPTREYGKAQEASDLIDAGAGDLFRNSGPQDFSKIKDAVAPERTYQALEGLNKRYGLDNSPYLKSEPIAAMAGAAGGSSAYGVASTIIQHLNSNKDPFQRLANIARAKQSLRQFAERVKSGEETPASYYKLVQAAANAGINTKEIFQ